MSQRFPLNPGIVMGIAAYGVWGLLPAFLKLLQPLPPVDVLAHRILWSLALLTIISLALRRGGEVRRIVRSPRLLGPLIVTALLIATNWIVYIEAVDHDRVLDASLGYFMNPLINVALGLIVLRERLGRVEVAAVLLALTGVAVLALWQGRLPLTSLALAFSFAFYGLIRKVTPVDASEGLLVETAVLAPFAALWLAFAGAPAGASPGVALLAMTGVLTTAPLLLFAAAAKRIRYADLGLLQYIAPSMQFLLAVFAYGELLDRVQLAAFVLIWTGLALYAGASWTRARRVPVTLPE